MKETPDINLPKSFMSQTKRCTVGRLVKQVKTFYQAINYKLPYFNHFVSHPYHRPAQ